jgi:hypothetical protein
LVDDVSSWLTPPSLLIELEVVAKDFEKLLRKNSACARNFSLDFSDLTECLSVRK